MLLPSVLRRYPPAEGERSASIADFADLAAQATLYLLAFVVLPWSLSPPW